MLINKMSEQQCREFLERSAMGRLGCSHRDQPYVVPINFSYDGEFLYLFSTAGQKVEWMRANPRVCLQVDEIQSHSEWVSVIVLGQYEELPEKQREAERGHARSLLEKRHLWWLNALAERRLGSSDASIEPIFWRIRIESLSGLRGGS